MKRGEHKLVKSDGTDADSIGGILGENGILSNRQGEQIGTYQVISSWTVRQVEATVNGMVYVGRVGCGSAFKGTAKKGSAS